MGWRTALRTWTCIATAEQQPLVLTLTWPRVHRLKATLERLQRMTQSYVDSLLLVFSERADRIGNALGLGPIQTQVILVANAARRCIMIRTLTVPRAAFVWMHVQVFSEAEIRASVVFQLSELVNALLKASRLVIGGSEWDALVAGYECLLRLPSDMGWCALRVNNALDMSAEARFDARKGTRVDSFWKLTAFNQVP